MTRLVAGKLAGLLLGRSSTSPSRLHSSQRYQSRGPSSPHWSLVRASLIVIKASAAVSTESSISARTASSTPTSAASSSSAASTSTSVCKISSNVRLEPHHGPPHLLFPPPEPLARPQPRQHRLVAAREVQAACKGTWMMPLSSALEDRDRSGRRTAGAARPTKNSRHQGRPVLRSTKQGAEL